MPFLLTIRHNLEAAEDHFVENTVTPFGQPRVRVGSAEDCEQVVPDDTFPAVAFSIAAEGTRLSFLAEGDIAITRNGEPAETGQELLSGDELRLGHWTFHVHKTYGEAGNPRRRTGLAVLARILVALVLLAELTVVVWLPTQVRAAAQRGLSLSRLRTFALLDSLRSRIQDTDDKEPVTEADRVRAAAQRAIRDDLERRARYLRRYGSELSAEQCRSMYSDLEELAGVLDHVATAGLLQPIPPVDVDAAVRAALRSAPAESHTP